MSTHIKGFININDPEFLKHKEVLLVCRKNNVSLPQETEKYFGDDSYLNDPNDILDAKQEFDLKEGVHYTEYSEDMIEGYEIFLDKLPKDLVRIKVYNAY